MEVGTGGNWILNTWKKCRKWNISELKGKYEDKGRREDHGTPKIKRNDDFSDGCTRKEMCNGTYIGCATDTGKCVSDVVFTRYSRRFSTRSCRSPVLVYWRLRRGIIRNIKVIWTFSAFVFHFKQGQNERCLYLNGFRYFSFVLGLKSFNVRIHLFPILGNRNTNLGRSTVPSQTFTC